MTTPRAGKHGFSSHFPFRLSRCFPILSPFPSAPFLFLWRFRSSLQSCFSLETATGALRSTNRKMDHHLTSQLNPSKGSFKIKGKAIKGTIRAQDVSYYKYVLKEGEIYLISNFIIAPNKQTFRAVPSNLILRFTRTTSIQQLNDNILDFPKYKFFFVDFEEISNRAYKDFFLMDVVGHIVSIGHLSTTYIRERMTMKRNLEIQDISERKIHVTLWGKMAKSFPEDRVLGRKNDVIIVLSGMTVRSFMGKTCLCSCSATKFYFDLDIPEVLELHQSFAKSVGPPTLLLEKKSSMLSPQQEAEDNKKTILELPSLDPNDYQDIKFSCHATIVDIDVSDGWWHRACPKCKAGLRTYENKFWCDRCCSIEDSPLPWFKLNLIVEDESGNANFIAFGKIVAYVVGIASTVLTASSQHSDRTLQEEKFSKKRKVLEAVMSQDIPFGSKNKKAADQEY